MQVQATGQTLSRTYTRKDLARTFDQSILRPGRESSTRVIQDTVQDATKEGYRALVVYPNRIKMVKNLLFNRDVLTASVFDFPYPIQTTAGRVTGVQTCLRDGADEVDIVSRYDRLLEHVYKDFEDDVQKVALAMGGNILKIILEVDYLDKELIAEATRRIATVAKENKQARLIVKTKTGFADGKFPNLEAVKIIRATLEETNQYAKDLSELGNSKVGIKASGGVSKDDATILLNVGAHVLGIGKGKKVLDEIFSV